MKKPFRERYSFFIVLLFFLIISLYFFVSRNLFGIPLFIYIFLFGLDVIWVNLSGAKKAIMGKSWPQVMGELISAEAVKKRAVGDGHNWFLEVRYKCVISGASYESDNYNWVGFASNTRDKIDKLTAKLRSTSYVMVRYNPNNHSETVIVSTVSLIYGVGVVFGVAISLVGVFGLLDYFQILKFGEFVKL